MGSNYLATTGQTEEARRKKKIEEESLRIAQEENLRQQQKAEQDALMGVSKGELPYTSIPQQYLPSTPIPQGMENRPWTTKVQPQDFANKMQSGYAEQQQAINPYKALQGQKLDAMEIVKQQIASGVPFEQVPIELKIQAGLMSPQGSQTDLLAGIRNDLRGMGGQVSATEAMPKYDPKKEKLMYSPSQKKYFVVPK